jgi:endo-1,4-beta-mannosidase
MELKALITQNTCTNTIAGWIWYCDNCITHGNANSSDEAGYMAEQHAKYYSWLPYEETVENEDEESIDYMNYDPALRDNPELDWQGDCLYASYLIDITSGVTYRYGEDYTDKTPNKIGDIAIALEVQKRMGLQ